MDKKPDISKQVYKDYSEKVVDNIIGTKKLTLPPNPESITFTR